MRTIRTTTISILALGLLAGSAVGVAAQDEEAAAGVTSFTATPSMEGEVAAEGTVVVLPNGFTEGDGFTWLSSWEASDPRFTGNFSAVMNSVMDPDGFKAFETGGQPNELRSSTAVLSNDGGSWLGEGIAISSTDLGIATEAAIFVGQDGYEGLTAYVLIDNTQFPATISGVVFPAAMPEAPEPYVAE